MNSLLLKCAACGSEISVNASACPKCGNPNHAQAGPTHQSGVPKNIGLGSIVGAGVVVTLLGFVLISKSRNSEYDDSRAPSSYQPVQTQVDQRKYQPGPSQEEGGSQNLEGNYGPRPEQSQAFREVSEYLRRESKVPMQVTSCMQVKFDEKAGWIVGCAFKGRGAEGENTKYANWFVIQNGRVVKDLPKNAYSIE